MVVIVTRCMSNNNTILNTSLLVYVLTFCMGRRFIIFTKNLRFLTRMDMVILASTKMMIPRMSNTPNIIGAKMYGSNGRLSPPPPGSERQKAKRERERGVGVGGGGGERERETVI